MTDPAAPATAAGAPSRSEIATMLPEPGQIGGVAASGDADELIAKMADAQIDRMLAEDEDGSPPSAESIAPISFAVPVTEPPPTPSTTPEPEPADPIAAVERSIGAAAAVEAALPPAAPEPVVEQPAVEQSVASDFANGALSDDAAAVAAELAADARIHQRDKSVPPPTSVAPAEVPAAPAEPMGSTEPTREELAALREPLPEVAGSAPAPVAATEPPAPEAAAVHPTIGELATASTEAPAAASEHADAPAPTIAQRLIAIPFVVLDAINYPVRNLSDAARESLGVVAIVTVVNAIGLIAYRAFFARH